MTTSSRPAISLKHRRSPARGASALCARGVDSVRCRAWVARRAQARGVVRSRVDGVALRNVTVSSGG